MPEEDIFWSPTERETMSHVIERVDYFLQTLARDLLHTQDDADNSSDSTLVVSHGVFLEVLFMKYFPQALEGGRRVYNCDLFKSILHITTWLDEGKNFFHFQFDDCNLVQPSK